MVEREAPRRERPAAASRPTPARSAREQEREDAYALNPDQPLPARPAAASADAASALEHGHRGRGQHGGKARPIPALLMKRKAPEPQSA